MRTTPNYAALVKLLPILRVFPDALGWTTLTPEEANKIRPLGFSAETGPWKVPPLPLELTLETPFESLSAWWGTSRTCPQPGQVNAPKQDREIQPGQVLKAAVASGERASTSDSCSMLLVREQDKSGLDDAKPCRTSPGVLRARHDRSREISKRQFTEKLQRLQAAGSYQGLPIFPDSAWERLRYKGMKFKDWLVQSRPITPSAFSPMIRELEWAYFKQMWADDDKWLPWLVWLLEPQYPGLYERRRPRKPKGSDPFEDMQEPFQGKARTIFARLCERWAWNLPSRRKAILSGRARWLAVHPPDSKWGRSMRAKRGGYAVQEKYRQQGHHPLGLVSSSKNQALTERP